MNNIKKTGFTLAEVLITLGIIGVVAAMTIPTLIANTNSAKFRSQFKKTISTLNQAGLMAEAQYDINYGSVNNKCGNTPGEEKATDSTTRTFCAILNGTLTGQSVATTRPAPPDTKDLKTVSSDTSKFYYYTLADGSMVAIPNTFVATGGKDDASSACTLEIGSVMNEDWITKHSACVGYIDVNGKTLPNKEVSCSEADTTTGEGSEAVTTSSTKLDPSAVCTVPSDNTHMTDIFPVVFHDATVEPATNAAKAVLAAAK